MDVRELGIVDETAAGTEVGDAQLAAPRHGRGHGRGGVGRDDVAHPGGRTRARSVVLAPRPVLRNRVLGFLVRGRLRLRRGPRPPRLRGTGERRLGAARGRHRVPRDGTPRLRRVVGGSDGVVPRLRRGEHGRVGDQLAGSGTGVLDRRGDPRAQRRAPRAVSRPSPRPHRRWSRAIPTLSAMRPWITAPSGYSNPRITLFTDSTRPRSDAGTRNCEIVKKLDSAPR